MSVSSLEDLLKQESDPNRSTQLSPVEHLYLEISTLLLQHARDDIDQPDRVRTLLEDIQNIRNRKLKQGLVAISHMEAQNRRINFVKYIFHFFIISHLFNSNNVTT